MEINPRHPIVSKLAALVEEDKTAQTTKDVAWSLYDTSLIGSGFMMEDPTSFTQRMIRLMKTGLNLESLELEAEIEIPEEPEESEEEEEEDIDDLDDDDELDDDDFEEDIPEEKEEL